MTNKLYDEEGYITHSSLPVKFKWSGGSKRPYADNVVGVIIKGVTSEEDAKDTVRQFGSYPETIYDNADVRKGWWEYYFKQITKLSDDEFHVFYVKPFTD